jgi:colanic acid biosynthesis glycosyl transferase WcaI
VWGTANKDGEREATSRPDPARPLRILILTIYHDPEPIPKTGELARELTRRGHTVTVVTSFPHYPSGDLYPGYHLALWRRERIAGVPVLRTFIYPYHGTRAALRMLNYVTWMVSAMQAAWLTPACDVIYVWHPPLTVGVTAWVLSKLKRVPFVYDIQDLWPESALASGLMRPGLLVRVLYRLADWVYARADRILVVSDAAARHLAARRVPRDKMTVAKHWVNGTTFEVPFERDVRTEFGLQGRFLVMFAGNLGLVQGLETVVAAAECLASCPEIVFVLVGDGSDRARLESLVAERRLDNLIFAGRHPAIEMPAFLTAADALIVHLRPSEIADHAVPTKILSYFAAARPIVCATSGAAAELVAEAEAGVTVPPGNPQQMAAAVLTLAGLSMEERSRLGRNGQKYLREHLAMDVVLNDYEHVLTETART